jgi:hypothetical protein
MTTNRQRCVGKHPLFKEKLMSAQEKLLAIRCKRDSAKKYREQSKLLVGQVKDALRQLRLEKAERIASIRKEYEGM